MLECANVPDRERFCPGTDCCDRLQQGPDPCAGCKAKRWLQWRPRYFTSLYAVILADYIEAFRPGPEEVTWLDFELYQLYLTARAEHEKEEERKFWKTRNMINDCN